LRIRKSLWVIATAPLPRRGVCRRGSPGGTRLCMQEWQGGEGLEAMSSLLADLPSRGLCQGSSALGRTRVMVSRKPALLYIATKDTAPPPNRVITTDKSNRLLIRFREQHKEKKAARLLKRGTADNGGSSAKKPRPSA